MAIPRTGRSQTGPAQPWDGFGTGALGYEISGMRTLLLALVVAVLCACSPDTTPAATAATPPPSEPGGTSLPTTTLPTSVPSVPEVPGDTITIGSLVRPTSLDPASAYTLTDWELLHALGDGPLVRRPGSDELVPGFASAPPDVTDDGATYTLTFPDDAVFADGTPLTATLYADQLRRVGALEGQASDLVNSFVADVETPDDTTVVIHLRSPVAFFPTVLAGAPYVAMPPDVVPADEPLDFPRTPLEGSGGWILTSLTATEIVLDRRQEADDGVARIVLRYYDNVDGATTALTDGDLDVLWRGLDAEAAVGLDTAEGIVVSEVPGGASHFLVVNHRSGPMTDPAVRRALAEIVDRAALVESADRRLQPLYSPVPPGFEGATKPFEDVYGEPDAAAAIELLSDAGYTASAPLQVELAYPPERYGIGLAETMETLEQQIESTGLVDVTLTAQPWNTYVGDVVDGVFDLAFLGWIYDYPDPNAYLAPFVLEGGMGGSAEPAGLERPEIVDLVAEAAIEPDPDRRRQDYEVIQELYASDVVTLPLWLDVELVAYRDEVTGDPEAPFADSLNIGPDMQLDFDVLRLEG